MNDVDEKGLALVDDVTGEVIAVETPKTVTELVTGMLPTAGTLKLTEEQLKVVFAPVKPELVEIREDGIVYLPAVEYKSCLCEAFGMEWAVLPESPKPDREGTLLLWGFYLFIQGRPVAFAWGEQDYQKGSYRMTYGDAMEGAKSNAIMRLCKQIGIGKELWRPSFVRDWKKRYAESYEGRDRQGNKKTKWRRKEKPDVAEETETETSEPAQERQQEPEDPERFRRSCFLLAEFLDVDDAKMKIACQQMFDVKSRSDMVPDQWVIYLSSLRDGMSPLQRADYDRWLDIRTAVKGLVERGLDKGELEFYLKTLYLRLDVLKRYIPDDLPMRLKRSNADKGFPGLQKGVKRTMDWAESIGGAGKAERLLEALNAALQASDSPETLLSAFFERMMVKADADGGYRLTDITPVIFEGWKVALKAVSPDPDPPGGENAAENATESREELLTPAQMFLAEADSRFHTDAERDLWIRENIGLKDISQWSVTECTLATQKLILLPEINAQGVKDDPSHSGTEEKDTPDEDFLIKPETLDVIKYELSIFPGKVYQTMRSNAFKTFAAEVVGVELETFKIKLILESDGQDIVTVLQEQRAELELAEKAAQGVPKPEPEDDPGGTESEDNGSDVMESYLLKANLRFTNRHERNLWEKENGLPDKLIAQWETPDLKRAYALLEGVPTIVRMTDDQFADMQGLIKGMPERYHQNLGSQVFRDFRLHIVKRKITTMRELTEAEADEIILQMKDAVQDENERIERMAEANKDLPN